ncbi:hypothetical protein UFOVP180_17 [uncultured Caudovirales phage]|uniref:Uncharacterized protein n=1 Tax=uncultured Caudovirales phage TaxID=2100421 RepID=A0A6J7WDD8_9CAUD|nr:hypothetical protein UFOVP180_17 [uncultured Caudovirales phage]
MTIEEAKSKIEEIYARTDIGEAQKAAMSMRVRSQCRRDNPEMDVDELGI